MLSLPPADIRYTKVSMVEEILTGRFEENKVRMGPESRKDLYEQGYFGKPSGKGLDLSLVEAVYLLDRSRILVLPDDADKDRKWLSYKDLFQKSSAREKGFEFRYVVYKDLRERGYYIQPGRPDFRVYPRGGHPGKTPAEFYVYVLSERMPVPLKEFLEPVRLAGQMRKRLMVAVVDEESDITFYEAREKSMIGKMGKSEGGGKATLLEDRVALWDEVASENLHHSGFYGKHVGGRLQLSLVESAYLLEKGAISIADREGKPLDHEEFRKRAKKVEEGFDAKYQVYKDLRDKGLVVKTGFKFGTHFRVYKQIEAPDKAPHSEYLVHTLPEDYVFPLPVLSRAVRLAHSVRKEMVFAYPEGNGVKYLEIRRLRP